MKVGNFNISYKSNFILAWKLPKTTWAIDNSLWQ